MVVPVRTRSGSLDDLFCVLFGCCNRGPHNLPLGRPRPLLILAIDFDGVLHDEHPTPPHKMGKPVEGAVEAMKQLRAQGHELIVHTVRASGPDKGKHVADWLRYFGIPFDRVTATKPQADIYIDDRGYRFTSWAQTL